MTLNRPDPHQTGPVSPTLNVSESGRFCVDPSPRRTLLAAMVVAVATFLGMVATEPRLAIVWDEGYSLGREARIRAWFQAIWDPTAFSATWNPPERSGVPSPNWKPPDDGLVQQQGAPPPSRAQVSSRSTLLFDPEVLAYFWPFAREEPHGHPPFYAILGLAGDWLSPGSETLSRARLGPILLFSLTAGALFHFVARRWGWWGAFASAGAWILQPNLFGHGHYAAYDGPLSSLWLLAIFAFVAAVDRDAAESRSATSRVAWPWVLVFGLVLGCAMADKLTGWFLPLPFLVWTMLYRRAAGAWTLAVGLGVGLLVTYGLQPAWWSEPIAGPLRFFQSNLTRAQTIPIPVLFLGRIYHTPAESLPWYNTIVLTFFVTPIGFLLLGLSGAYRSLARWKSEPILLLILGHWLFLMALRALPNTPGHDGVRLFLPAFGILALLAGPGGAQVASWLGRLGRGVVILSVVEGLVSLILLMPTPLAYYSPLVGGPAGAAKLGMEPTYYWDALDADARAWLRSETSEGRTIQFATFPTSWLYLRSTGELPAKLAPLDAGSPQWYVLQNRPGAWNPWDRLLATRATPAYTVSKRGVPLVWVFPYEALMEAMREVRR